MRGTPRGAPPSPTTEAKTQPARALLRKIGDDPGDDDVLAFELGRQGLVAAATTLASR